MSYLTMRASAIPNITERARATLSELRTSGKFNQTEPHSCEELFTLILDDAHGRERGSWPWLNRRRQLCPVESNVLTEFQRTKTTGSVLQHGKIGGKSDLRSPLQMAGLPGDYASG